MEQLADHYKNDLNKYYNGICLDLDTDKEQSQYTEINKSIIAGSCSTLNGEMSNIALANIKESDTSKADTYQDKYDRPNGEVQILTQTADGLNIFMDNLTAYGLTDKQHMETTKNDADNTEDPTTKSVDTGFYNSQIRTFIDNNVPFIDTEGVKIKAIACREDKENTLTRPPQKIYTTNNNQVG